MKKIAFLLIVLLAFSCKKENKAIEFGFDVHDDAFYEIIDASASIDTIAEGFTWSEGPVWVESEQMLLWSDVPGNAVWSWKEGEQAKQYLNPSGYTGTGQGSGANGLIINNNGKLVLCQHGDRRLVEMNAPLNAPQVAYNYIATLHDGKRFNSPNDVIQDSEGIYFFTDPPYGLEGKDADPAKEIPYNGVYRTIPSDETRKDVVLLTDDLTRPNGLALSPDEKILYVANSDPQKAIWMKYELNENKTFKDAGEVFFDATEWVENKQGLPDGLKVRSDGTLFATGPGGVLVFTPEGKHLGTIVTGQKTANCAFNADESVLFMTADNYVMKVALK